MGTTLVVIWAVWFGGFVILHDKAAQLRREEDGSFFHCSEVEEVPQQ